MHRRTRTWFALIVWISGCVAELAPPQDSQDGAGAIAAAPPADPNGQTGSIGQSPNECKVDDDCAARAELELEGLANPGRSARMFESGVCDARNVSLQSGNVSGPACVCKQGTGTYPIGPVGLGCYALGRAGDCLWGDSEFAGCKLGETDQCSAMCEELEARFTADAARSFAGHVRYARCDAGRCNNVVEIEGRCYADRSYERGKSYACELGDEEILARHLAPPATQPPPMTAFPSYPPDTDGSVRLTAATSFVGSVRTDTRFGGSAEFFDDVAKLAGAGTVIDPLEGLDDCGVSSGRQVGSTPQRYQTVDSAVLIDGDRELPFRLSSASNGTYASYLLDLTELGVAPRFDADYGFRARGGSFGGAVEIEAIHLPAELSIHELEAAERVPNGPLQLTWSGQNRDPLRVFMTVTPKLGDYSKLKRIECLLRDDGSFEIPAKVFEAAGDGFVTAEFDRDSRVLAHSGGKAVFTLGQSVANHRFALGERCERRAVLDACLNYVEHARALREECGGGPAPRVETSCPAYLGEACGGCPEYFECLAQQTSCGANGPVTRPGSCSCPAL